MGWLTAENKWVHSHVPENLVKEADQLALAAIVGQAAVVTESEEKSMEITA